MRFLLPHSLAPTREITETDKWDHERNIFNGLYILNMVKLIYTLAREIQVKFTLVHITQSK